jgi:hypothetical protein
MHSMKRKGQHIESDAKRMKVFHNSELAEGRATAPAAEYLKRLANAGLLERIIKQVDQRRSLAQVNKLFYETVCKIENEEGIYRAFINLESIQDVSGTS